MRIIDFSLSQRILSALVFWTTMIAITMVNKLWFGLRVHGREKLRRLVGKGFFIISNHSLYLDPAIISHAIIPRRAHYSALQKHFSVPFLRGFIRYLGAFPIPDRLGLTRIVPPIREALKRGWLVHFFPEGDMTHMNPDIGPFRKGVFFLANLFQVPIVPVTIVKKPRVLFGRVISRHAIRIAVVVDDPIFPGQRGKTKAERRRAIEEMGEEARRVMRRAIKKELARLTLFSASQM